jgi:hypothetical protein
MAYRQSNIERCWNAFALLVCLAAGGYFGYWHCNLFEGILFPLLMIAAGSMFARLIGVLPHDGLYGGEGRTPGADS